MYIFEAAFEYLISILVSGSFLATLTKELGISDSLTGVLSSVISLGCLFQLLSISITKTSVKRIVVFFSILNQLIFMLLYVIPLTNLNQQIKVVLFVLLIFSAYLIYNVVHPKKISWLMSLVDDEHRGSFTANKEIISLLLGMIFSFLMGFVIDYFIELNRIRTAFTISAVVIFCLMVLHTLTMLLAVEKEISCSKMKNLKQTVGSLLKNKTLQRVVLLFVFYNIANYICVPFYGTYQINELGLDLKFISAITIFGTISRIAVSKFWGKYADKKSFAAMIEKCLYFFVLSQICVVFAVPQTGKIMFPIYYLFHGIALGGINSALINLVFDYVSEKDRANSLAVTQALAGLTGFLTTLCISPLVSFIQNNGIKLFRTQIYAQQVVTVFALVITLGLIFYIRIQFSLMWSSKGKN